MVRRLEPSLSMVLLLAAPSVHALPPRPNWEDVGSRAGPNATAGHPNAPSGAIAAQPNELPDIHGASAGHPSASGAIAAQPNELPDVHGASAGHPSASGAIAAQTNELPDVHGASAGHPSATAGHPDASPGLRGDAPKSASSAPGSPAGPLLTDERSIRSSTEPLAGDLSGARWLISLERITVLGLWNSKHETASGIQVNLSGHQAAFVGGAVATGADVAVNPYALPRLAVDTLVTSHATIGLGLSLYTRGGEWTATRGDASGSGDGERAWLVSATPRLGYFNAVTEKMAIWARLGTTFSKQHTKNAISQADVFLTSADVELTALFRLLEHAALATTVCLALPVVGKYEARVDSAAAASMELPAHERYDVRFTSFALHTSVVGYL